MWSVRVATRVGALKSFTANFSAFPRPHIIRCPSQGTDIARASCYLPEILILTIPSAPSFHSIRHQELWYVCDNTIYPHRRSLSIFLTILSRVEYNAKMIRLQTSGVSLPTIALYELQGCHLITFSLRMRQMPISHHSTFSLLGPPALRTLMEFGVFTWTSQRRTLPLHRLPLFAPS